MKHYTDSTASHTNGYRFLCSCPPHMHCPIVRRAQAQQGFTPDGSDHVGPFHYGHCHLLPGIKADSVDVGQFFIDSAETEE
jgi:hypothetical protein